MRIKEEFNRSGDFWLPSSPENKIPGTLSISDGGDAKLELSKPLDSSIQAQVGYTNPDSLKRILGHVEKDGPVMIDRCYRTKTGPHFLRGRMRTTLVIWTNRVFMGIPYEGDASPRFYTCSFSVEGIDEWVDITGIEVDPQFENSTLTISYNRPEDITFSLENGMQLQITFAWTPPGMPATKRAEVTQKVYFTLVSKKPLELDKFISVAEKITAFLCFVWNEIVCLDSISATSDNQRQENGGSHTEEVNIYCSSWPYAKDEPVLNTLDVLFKYKDIQSCAESIIGKWLQNYKHIAPAYDLYFLTKAKTLPTLDLHFLILAQALEAFHGRTSNEKHEFRERFEIMTEPFADFMCGEGRPGLIDKIVKKRNYLTHHNPKLEPVVAKGELLAYICRKMDALFRLQFLKLIGFDDQEINNFVDKCPYFKGECNL